MLTNCSFYFHKRQQNTIMNLFIEPILKKAVGRFHLFINSFMQEQFSYMYLIFKIREMKMCVAHVNSSIFLCVAFFFLCAVI